MAKKTTHPAIRIELTAEQREQVRRVLGRAPSVDLKPEELEERVAPGSIVVDPEWDLKTNKRW